MLFYLIHNVLFHSRFFTADAQQKDHHGARGARAGIELEAVVQQAVALLLELCCTLCSATPHLNLSYTAF
jgi:hypothetical protein